MKKNSDSTPVSIHRSKATRAKASKKVDAARSDVIPSEGFAIAASERSASVSEGADINREGQPARGLSDDRLLDEPCSPTGNQHPVSAAFSSESVMSGCDKTDANDFLLSQDAGFSVNTSSSSMPKINARPALGSSLKGSSLEGSPMGEDRHSAMAQPSERIAPANSVRRHAINRAPNFQTNYLPVTQSSDRIAIFIDGSNLFYAASHLNIEVDYRRLLTTLVRGRRLLRAYFYTGVDPQNEKQRGFLLWLNRHGHRVVSKELVQLPDGSRKANMHVEMAVDMMRISEYCSTLTLLGGDGNLAYALEVLSQRGISIEVVSLQSMTSDSLIDLADSYTDLADLRDEIKR